MPSSSQTLAKRFLLVTTLLATAGLLPSRAFGQDEAARALESARASIAAEDYESAERFLRIALDTRPQDPEVHWLIGRSKYARADLGGAIAAWRTTLELAPEHQRARRLLEALSGERRSLEGRLDWIERLLASGLILDAKEQLGALRSEEALDQATLGRVLVLSLRIALAADEGTITAWEELRARAPAASAESGARVLGARALVRSGRRAEAREILERVREGETEGATRAEAEFELALLDRAEGRIEGDAELVAWIASHAEHPRLRDAWRSLLELRIERARRSMRSAADAPLSASDRSVLEVVLALWTLEEDQRTRQNLLARAGAFLKERSEGEALARGWELLHEAGPPAGMREEVLRELVRARFAWARRVVLARGENGTLASLSGRIEELPPVAAALAIWRVQRAEYPAGADRATVLAFVQALAAIGHSLGWPPADGRVPAVERWAFDLCVELAEDRVEPTSSAALTQLMHLAERRALLSPVEAAEAVAPVLAALDPASGPWQDLALRSIDWRGSEVVRAFDRDRDGVAELAALVQTTSQLVARRPVLGQQLAAPLATRFVELSRKERGARRENVDAAWRDAVTSLPDLASRQLQSARIDEWIARVSRRRTSLAAAGIASSTLDPEAREALIACYAGQRGVAEDDAFAQRLKGQRAAIVALYDTPRTRTLAYEALSLRDGGAPVPAAESHLLVLEFALRNAEARQAADVALAAGGSKGERPEEIDRLLALFARFANEHPGHVGLGAAGESIFALSAHISARGAGEWSLSMLADVEGAATAEKNLAARARFATAELRHAEGLRLRAEADASREDLGEMLSIAIDDYAHVLNTWPRSRGSAACVARVQSLVRSLASTGGWSAAGQAVDRFVGAAPALSTPERWRVARIVCDLGEVLGPDAVALLARIAPTSDQDDVEEEAKPAASSGPADPQALLALGYFDAKEAFKMTPMAESRNNLARFDLQLVQARRAAEAQLAQRAARLTSEVGAGRGSQSDGRSPDVLPPEEIERRVALFEKARKELQELLAGTSDASASATSRAALAAVIESWRRHGYWDRAAAFGRRVAEGDLNNPQRPQLLFESGRDLLRWAAAVASKAGASGGRRELDRRFEGARKALFALAEDSGMGLDLQRGARSEAVRSFLAQARAIAGAAPKLARGPYVRAALELARAGREQAGDPFFATVSTEILALGEEMTARGLAEGAVEAWRALIDHFPSDPLAPQAALRIAQTWQLVLGRPSQAVEAYLELHYASGMQDNSAAEQILGIANQLQNERRWIEALYALEVFVEGFPEHPQAGTSMERIGFVHAENGAWEEALDAYRRVLAEHEGTPIAKEARWETATAFVHLSRWRDAERIYREWAEGGGDQPRLQEAQRRVAILKSLARYQDLVDEPQQRKAFDAQFQIGHIVQNELGETAKAMREYEKVSRRWPKSHLADDALYQVGLMQLERGESELARRTLLELSTSYPASPLADDALFQVGRSYEGQADQLAAVTRSSSLAVANEVAQRQAYQLVLGNRRAQAQQGAKRLAAARDISRAEADRESAFLAMQACNFDFANNYNANAWVQQQVELLTAEQLVDRQDRINAALRRAVSAFRGAALVPSGDKADQALLRMAQIYDERLEDADAALAAWAEIARLYSGTAVAEDASWRLAEAFERRGKQVEAIEAFSAFLRNYRRSPKAGDAQIAIAEAHESLGRWVEAMDAYSRYLESFPDGPAAGRASDQIAWIKTYRL